MERIQSLPPLAGLELVRLRPGAGPTNSTTPNLELFPLFFWGEVGRIVVQLLNQTNLPLVGLEWCRRRRSHRDGHLKPVNLDRLSQSWTSEPSSSSIQINIHLTTAHLFRQVFLPGKGRGARRERR